MKILVIGESCRDIFIYGECSRLCPEAPVPVFNPVKSVENGGMAKNVYRNVSSLGAKVNLFTNENWKGITKTRYIDFNMNHMFMRVDENDKQYGRSNIDSISFENYDAVIISDYNKGFLSETDIKNISLKHDCVFLDTKKYLGSWCENVKYIKINEHEYENNKKYITNNIKDKTIITLGPKGSIYKDTIYPVPKVEIRDVSGAGDSFIAGLVVKYIEKKDIIDAIKFANCCATQVVQKKGVSIV